MRDLVVHSPDLPEGPPIAKFWSAEDADDYRRLRQAMTEQGLTMADVLRLIEPTIFDNQP